MTPRPTPTPRRAQMSGPTPAELLAKMPRRPLTPEQQAAALMKVQQVQQQATERVKLGQQLFEAAESRLKRHQGILQEIQEQQQKLREQVQEDVAKSLQSYDQWMGRIDESFTSAIKELNQRIDVLETRVDCSHGDMERMIAKAGALLEQTQGLLADAFGEGTVEPSLLESMMGDDMAATEINAAEPVQDTQAPRTATETESPEDEEDDVFGEVLRRLRSQAEEDEDGHAAA